MQILQYIFLYALTSLVSFKILSEGKGYCFKEVPVVKSRWVTVNRLVIITKRNFFNNYIKESVPAEFLIQEYYNSSAEQMVCCEGYVDTSQGCKPICSTDCAINMQCVEPDVCECLPGYVAIDDICQPVCNRPCDQNTYCAAPDLCSCKPGYEADKFSLHQNCVAKCSESIPKYSECIAPNIWRCQKGYVSNDLGQCEPVCNPSCAENSLCVEPNKCECQQGYKLYELTAKCLPICNETCAQSLACVAPDVCGCAAGYEFHNESGVLQYCAAICSQDCSEFGKCIAPNICQCFDGYEAQHEQIHMPLCRPKCCKNCINGFCFAPDVCVCNSGYIMGADNKCEAICSLGCQFGDCMEPEICTCWPGYQMKAQSVNVCEPICAQSCVNADCVAPGVCSCWPNYTAKHSAQFAEHALVCEPEHEHSLLQTTIAWSITDDVTTASYDCPDSCACWKLLAMENTTTTSCLRSCSEQISINETCLDLTTCSCEQEDTYSICQVAVTADAEQSIRYQCLNAEPPKAASTHNAAAFWSLLLMALTGLLFILISVGFLLKRFIKAPVSATYDANLERVDLHTE